MIGTGSRTDLKADADVDATAEAGADSSRGEPEVGEEF